MRRSIHFRYLTAGAFIMLSSLLTACTNLALQAINTPSYLFSDLQSQRDIAYGDADHQRLDLFLPPAGAPNTGALVVFVYGGSWTSGTKEAYYFVADALTRHGYAVAIPDYIKYPDGVFPAFVEDIALAVAWLENNAEHYGNRSTLYLMGHSAGAHTGALLITDERYLARHALGRDTIDAYIGLAGPYGFKPKEQKFRDIFANLDDFNQMRPLHFVSGVEPPVLLLHGEKDTTVLPVNTRQFAGKIDDTGGRAEHVIYDDQSHVSLVLAFSRVFDREAGVLSDVLDFMGRVRDTPRRDIIDAQ
jgi:acetyl esterase/lipase